MMTIQFKFLKNKNGSFPFFNLWTYIIIIMNHTGGEPESISDLKLTHKIDSRSNRIVLENHSRHIKWSNLILGKRVLKKGIN